MTSNEMHLDLFTTGAVLTPEIERFCKAVVTNVRLDIPGMLVYGNQRVGKTYACKYLCAVLPAILERPTPTYLWRMPGIAAKSAREFYQERLQQSHCPGVIHRDAAVLKKRLYDHISGAVLEQGADRAVVVIDEAQNLYQDEYNQLIHIHNELEYRRVRPFFILIGQPELRDAPGMWRSLKAHQILGRFMSAKHEFRGITPSQVTEVLKEFDHHEPGGDAPNVRVVFEEDYADGWQLQQLSGVIEEGISIIARKHNIQEQIFIPLQYLRSMTLALLYHARDSGISPRQLSVKHVVEAATTTDFVNVFADYVGER